MSYHENRRQIEQIQESKRDNKQPIAKQFADSQSEGNISHSGEKGEKKEEIRREKSVKTNKYYVILLVIINFVYTSVYAVECGA